MIVDKKNFLNTFQQEINIGKYKQPVDIIVNDNFLSWENFKERAFELIEIYPLENENWEGEKIYFLSDLVETYVCYADDNSIGSFIDKKINSSFTIE